MTILRWITIIIGFILATIIVNKVQQLYMKLIGAEYMFFSAKKKLIAIIIIGLLFSAMFWNFLGLA